MGFPPLTRQSIAHNLNLLSQQEKLLCDNDDIAMGSLIPNILTSPLTV